jgi:hypothetical protein
VTANGSGTVVDVVFVPIVRVPSAVFLLVLEPAFLTALA